MTEEEKEQLHIKSLPTNLHDAVCAMERDAFIREILGEHISNVYIGSKKDEWDRYCKTVQRNGKWTHISTNFKKVDG